MMRSEPQFRPATQRDADALERCARRAYAPFMDLPGMPDVAGDMTGEIAALQSCVAEIDGARGVVFVQPV